MGVPWRVRERLSGEEVVMFEKVPLLNSVVVLQEWVVLAEVRGTKVVEKRRVESMRRESGLCRVVSVGWFISMCVCISKGIMPLWYHMVRGGVMGITFLEALLPRVLFDRSQTRHTRPFRFPDESKTICLLRHPLKNPLSRIFVRG